VYVKLNPSVDKQTEKQYSELFTEAGRIVSRMNTKGSKVRALLKKIKPKLSELEKDDVRTRLKSIISTALKEDGSISPKMADKLTPVLMHLLIEGVELDSAETGDSIILYLKCGSVESLVNLKEMILSHFLPRLLSDTIEEFIESRIGIQLVVKAEDYNLTLSYLNSVAGKSLSLHVLHCKRIY